MLIVRSYNISIPAWSVGTCLSMKSSPQTVLFDAATIFGGIIQEGKPKPGDSLPSNKRDWGYAPPMQPNAVRYGLSKRTIVNRW